MPKLDLAAKTAGADRGPGSQFLQLRTIGDEGVARVLPLRNGSKFDTGGKLKRDILHAVNSEIDAAIQERFVDFFREESLAADLCQGDVEDLVAGCLDRHQLNGQL